MDLNMLVPRSASQTLNSGASDRTYTANISTASLFDLRCQQGLTSENAAPFRPPYQQPGRLSVTQRPLPPIPVNVNHDMAAANNTNGNGNNAFPALDASNMPGNGARAAGSIPASQVNGNGTPYASNYMPPLPLGHQQDLSFLYQQIQELSALLHTNRDRVNEVTKSAEDVARRSHMTNGHAGSESTSTDEARIRELESELAKANKLIDLYKHEQKENTSLVGQYEQGMWNAKEQIREYASNNEERLLVLKKNYNDMLQQEKDEHHETRLDRDRWHDTALHLGDMLRAAYRLRVDEWSDEYRVIIGLQSEVRCYRRCLGIEPEKPEEETGWPYLKDAPVEDQT